MDKIVNQDDAGLFNVPLLGRANRCDVLSRIAFSKRMHVTGLFEKGEL